MKSFIRIFLFVAFATFSLTSSAQWDVRIVKDDGYPDGCKSNTYMPANMCGYLKFTNKSATIDVCAISEHFKTYGGTVVMTFKFYKDGKRVKNITQEIPASDDRGHVLILPGMYKDLSKKIIKHLKTQGDVEVSAVLENGRIFTMTVSKNEQLIVDFKL